MPRSHEEELETLVNDVLSSPKYRYICADLIRGIGSRELEKRRNRKEAVKATKNKLHQIGGAYLDEREDYSVWLDELASAAQTGDRAELQQVCRSIMQHHASTRERLPILDQFYTTILADLAPIHSILDLACGLNPLALPWLPLAENATYYGCDIYQHVGDFLNQYLHIMHIKGSVQTCDVMQSCPTYEVDVASVLKTIPCLEQVDKRFGYRLLRAINARYLVVSFPVHSLGGRNKGMTAYYESHFRELLGDETWEVRKFEFATELAFVVKK